MNVSAVDNSLSSEALKNKKTINPKSVLGKDDFLKLLIVQLKNQDPTNPLDDKQFIAENAQFSSLEQLTNINSAIENLTSTDEKKSFVTASNMIGKRVASSSQSIRLNSGKATPVHFNLSDSANVTAIITDKNNNVVENQNLGNVSKGEHSFVWNGLDNDGNEVSDGSYSVSFVASGPDGEPVNLTKDAGIVTGIGKVGNDIVLYTNTGATLNINDVTKLYDTSGGSSQ